MCVSFFFMLLLPKIFVFLVPDSFKTFGEILQQVNFNKADQSDEKRFPSPLPSRVGNARMKRPRQQRQRRSARRAAIRFQPRRPLVAQFPRRRGGQFGGHPSFDNL